MRDLLELIGQFDELIAEAKADARKQVERGNVVAGTRLRNKMREIEKLATAAKQTSFQLQRENKL